MFTYRTYFLLRSLYGCRGLKIIRERKCEIFSETKELHVYQDGETSRIWEMRITSGAELQWRPQNSHVSAMECLWSPKASFCWFHLSGPCGQCFRSPSNLHNNLCTRKLLITWNRWRYPSDRGNYFYITTSCDSERNVRTGKRLFNTDMLQEPIGMNLIREALPRAATKKP